MTHRPRKSMAACIAVFIIALYVAGMVCSIFGPKPGRLLGVFAFLCTFIYFVVVVNRRYRKAVSVQQCHTRVRKAIRYTIGTCFLAFGIGFVICAAAPGVHDGAVPVVWHQANYQLSSHGEITSVSRKYYVLVGVSAVVSWHAFGISMALSALYAALYGCDPLNDDAYVNITKPNADSTG